MNFVTQSGLTKTTALTKVAVLRWYYRFVLSVLSDFNRTRSVYFCNVIGFVVGQGGKLEINYFLHNEVSELDGSFLPNTLLEGAVNKSN